MDLAHALKIVHAMDIKAKELICDELFVQQPNLLASVMVQNQMGNSMNDVDVLLNILIVLHLAMKEAGFFKRKSETSKYLLMAGINLVSCITDAKKSRAWPGSSRGSHVYP